MRSVVVSAGKFARWTLALPIAWFSAWIVTRILLWVLEHNPALQNPVSHFISLPTMHLTSGAVIGVVVTIVAPEPRKHARWLALLGSSLTAGIYIARFPDVFGVIAGLCQVVAAWYSSVLIGEPVDHEEEERIQRVRALYFSILDDDDDLEEDDDNDQEEHVSPGKRCPNCTDGVLIRLRSGAVCCPNCSEKWHAPDQGSLAADPIPVFLAEAVRDHLGEDFPAPSGNGSRSNPLVISATENYVRYEYEAARVAMMLLGLDYKSEGNRLHSPQGGRYIDELVFAVKPRGAVEWTGRRSLFFDVTAGFGIK